jgi:pyruvate/2-oxoglutarate dehydrogenase complex dihydrolipoamide dehydrogenase (E3) component
MTVDLDVVIIGGTIHGREAAAIAAREGARVALVEPPGAMAAYLQRQLTIQVLTETGHQVEKESFNRLGSAGSRSNVTWTDLQQRVRQLVEIAYPQLSLEDLAVRGVDTVLAAGQFAPKPRLALTTAERRLRARGYLLSPATEVTVPAIPGLTKTPYLTPETLLDLDKLPEEVVILGRSGDAISLAQSLAFLGSSVTLITRGEQLLPTEDRDISTFAESLLIAAGVNLLMGAQLAAIHHQHHWEIQFPDGESLKTQHLVLGTGRQPQVVGLNLNRVGISTNKTGLPVDDRLVTTRSRAFACGPCLGGYWAENTDYQDVTIALHNALYLPYRKLATLQRVGMLPTSPEFARLGFTAHQARHWYGNDVAVIQLPLSEVSKFQVTESITGFCRWILHRDGCLLGAQIFGEGACDLIQTAALMMQRNIPIHQLRNVPFLPTTRAEIVYRIAEAWQDYRWNQGTWRRDWAENWFNWRRSRRHH